MSKIITFSTSFPSYHIRKGEPTYFVEKFWESIGLPDKEYVFSLPDQFVNFLRKDSEIICEKHHTIRAGKRFKEGEYFSPRIWSGKPYRSKQIIIAPDTLIVKTYDIEINKGGSIFINNKHYGYYGEICKNDGLTPKDFRSWFNMDNYEGIPKEPFFGQIIVWNEKINY